MIVFNFIVTFLQWSFKIILIWKWLQSDCCTHTQMYTYSTLLDFGEMHIKATLNIISHPVEWLKWKGLTILSEGESVEKMGTLIRCWWECRMVQLWETLWLHINLPYDPAISFLGIYPRKMSAYICWKTCVRMFIEAFFSSYPFSSSSPYPLLSLPPSPSSPSSSSSWGLPSLWAKMLMASTLMTSYQ